MKRFSVLLVTFVMMLSLIAPNIAKASDDITDHYFETDMRVLIHKGILSGYGDGIYLPNKPVTRAEFASFLVRALDLKSMGSAEFSVAQVSESTTFTDVDTGDWYYSPIMVASSHKLVGGYPNGSFGPNKKISRQEMAAMIMRAINSKGVVSEKAPLDFKDNSEIKSMFHDPVQRLLYLGIMSGKKDNKGNLYFAPLDSTTRGETSAVINRMLKTIAPPESLDYKVATLSDGKDPIIVGEYETFNKAKSHTQNNQVVMHGNNVVWIESGLAISNGYTEVYTSTSLSSTATYVTSGVEMKYYEATEDWVKVKLADVTGYVKPSNVNLQPLHLVKNRSNYEVINGVLVHNLYNPLTKSWDSYDYGKAPNFLTGGKQYYSWNGNTFYHTSGAYAGEAYQYFNRMPLYTKTQYTAEQLDQYVRSVKPNSPLIGTGSAFKKAEKESGTNAMYFLAHAILESSWGESKIARDKNNLFGIGAVDSNPYEGAYTYDNYEDGILEAAKEFIVPGYFDQKDWRFEGEHLGNKSTGMNVRYASDAYWGQKIAGLMFRMDKYLSNKYSLPSEYGKYQLAETITTDVNVRSEAKVGSSNQLYQINDAGVTVQILDTISATGTWYKIAPKNVLDKNYSETYTYSHGYGPYGTSYKLLPIAE
jgi:beta-N-acetylglucosaminidase